MSFLLTLPISIIKPLNPLSSYLENYEYVIPDYQRPYSWGKDECVKLWEDLTTYAEALFLEQKKKQASSAIRQSSELYDERDETENSPYFLGNVVIYNENRKRNVVDGQQRLITLSLLLRAFFTQCGTLTILEKILYRKNVRTGDVENPYQIKITHNVLGENEHEKLEAAILNHEEVESNYRDNYNELLRLTSEKLNDLSADEKEEFILTLTENVVLLPIECTDFDSALTIFETINNRGMELSDADIFKSKLYKYAANDKAEFISRWNELVSNVEEANTSLRDIFTRYMHVLRGKEKNIDTLVALRKFYDQDSGERLQNWREVMDSLDKLVWAWNYIHDKNFGAPINILNWSMVLQYYPNAYWEYPVMTFLHNSIELQNDKLAPTFNPDDLLKLQKEVARYCYWKWLKYRGVVAIKDTIFKVVRDIVHNEDYRGTFQNNLKDEGQSENQNKGSFKDILCRDLGRKAQKGICLLATVLNEHQVNRQIPEEFQIEHILPRKWDYYKYDGWNLSTFHTSYNRLGNLMPLEKNLNIRAGNKFFTDKKIQYGQSDIEEVLALGRLSEWTPETFRERDDKVVGRIIDFLMNKTTI